MGDRNRFNIFANFIQTHFRPTATVEVASGNGKLYAELSHRGFTDVTLWDKRQRNAGPRRLYRWGHFNYHNAPRGYQLIIGMHPDAGTDHILGYAIKHRVPFAVVPCCVLPSAFKFEAIGYDGWIQHLTALARNANFQTTITQLPMSGRNLAIAGWPQI